MFRAIFIAAAIAAAPLLSGCSFTPVYAEHDPRGQMSLAFDMEEPNSRTEQVIYQELALRFATTTGPNTPVLKVSTRVRSSDKFLSAGAAIIDPATGRMVGRVDNAEVTVSATATVTHEGKVIFTATREASAGFQTSSTQALADRAAREEAEERAAKSAAESLRLAILATFPSSGSYLN